MKITIDFGTRIIHPFIHLLGFPSSISSKSESKLGKIIEQNQGKIVQSENGQGEFAESHELRIKNLLGEFGGGIII